MLKVVVKVLVLLCLLFVVLYVGMNNVHEIDFNFPIAGTTAKKPIHAVAALIFFAMFAIGFLGGAVITAGGRGGAKRGGGKEK